MALLLALAVAAASADVPGLVPAPPSLPCAYGVIGVRLGTAGDSLVVAAVVPGGPADRAGLHRGDRVLGLAPYRTRTIDEFSRCAAAVAPGHAAPVVTRRRGQDTVVTCLATDVFHLYPTLSERGPRQYDRRQPPEPRTRPGVVEAALAAAADTTGITADLASLAGVLGREAARYGADDRLAEVDTILAHPLAAPDIARALATALTDAADVATWLTCATAPLAATSLPQRSWAVPAEASATATIDSLLAAPVEAAAGQVAQAWADLHPSEQERLVAGLLELLPWLARGGPAGEDDSLATARRRTTVVLAKRLRFSWLQQAALTLSWPAAPAARQALRRAATALPVIAPPPSLAATCQGRLRYARRTSAGWVVVGDTGPNTYGGSVAAVLDLGGDDRYDGLAAVAGSLPCQLVIDCGGNDRYLGGPSAGSAGGAIGGVAMLIDLAGDDVYAGGDVSQGAALGGIGVLMDRQGRDVYRGGQVTQGAAVYGAGLLVDEGGDDQYESRQFAQGSGGPASVGVLLDRGGNDAYTTAAGAPSAYATPEVHQAWSQGTGYGWRELAAGGLGLLVDAAGDDHYNTGEFGQGSGYFFGMGVLVDALGADSYVAARYAQGAAAHQAVGVLIDSGGDDRYSATVAASQGAGWDAAVGLLVDVDGADRYQGGELAQGAAAMNAVGVLLDLRGRDQYQCRTGQGWSGAVTYWGGRQAGNVAMLVDLGAGIDTYSQTENRDGSRGNRPGTAVFLDR